MLYIDTNEMVIKLTREDSATIEFSAKEGTETYLAQSGDSLTFAVAKKYGGDKSFSITNVFDDKFKQYTPTDEEFAANKSNFFKKPNDVYIRCTDSDSKPNPCYINEMWNIEILPSHTKDMKFADYYWDLQLTVNEGEDAYTIIGKCDEYEPKLTIWGEVV